VDSAVYKDGEDKVDDKADGAKGTHVDARQLHALSGVDKAPDDWTDHVGHLDEGVNQKGRFDEEVQIRRLNELGPQKFVLRSLEDLV